MENKRVLLGMSGGVDSSVSALLLKNMGYDVIGITLELFAGSSCCNTNTYIDAKNVCNSLGIPHITYNLKDEFRCKVIDNFISEYSNQRTPNPCIECNKYMKFGAMYEKAKELGCEYIATGHYAKMEYSDEFGKYVLKKSNNVPKDQSYVLYNLPKEMLGKIIFPLGEFSSKDEVRKIARENNLKTASKPDSEDICFVPDGNYKRFLEENSDLKPIEGDIVTSKGEVLGKHQGLYRYTIGQRKGLGISYKVPLFVIGFNKAKNQVIVGEKEELFKKEFLVNEVNLLLVDDEGKILKAHGDASKNVGIYHADEPKGSLEEGLEVDVKTRYSSNNAKAIIKREGKNIKVILDEPQRAITPGQSAVFYYKDIVIGGGKIMD